MTFVGVVNGQEAAFARFSRIVVLLYFLGEWAAHRLVVSMFLSGGRSLS